MDQGLLISALALAGALFIEKQSYVLCGAALLGNALTTLLVYQRVYGKFPADYYLQGSFPLYDRGRMYSTTLVTIAGCFPIIFICLSTWLSSSLSWWMAATFLVIDFYVLLEALEEGYDRIKAAEKNIKDGMIWKNKQWKMPPPSTADDDSNTKKQQ
jgi:hypothetical protein